MSRNCTRGAQGLAASQISTAVIGLRSTLATAARCFPRFNQLLLLFVSDISFVTTAGLINLSPIPFGNKLSAFSEASCHKALKGAPFHEGMNAPTDDPGVSPTIAEPLATDLDGLEELLHLRSHILETKLKVLAAGLLERFDLRDRNVVKVDTEKQRVIEVMPQLARQARYHLREPRDNATFYQQAFRLDEEGRSQQVGCWQDVARVMRDFLDVWEAHQQAAVRGRFLQNAGQ
jgi:hypothetical protein